MTPEKAATESAPGVDSRSQKASGGLRRFVWPLVCMFQLGLIGGAFQLGSRLADVPPPIPATEKDGEGEPLVLPMPQEPLGPSRNRAAKSELEEVDRLLRAGRPELALAICRTLNGRVVAELRDAFLYRMGLSLESMGHGDEALASYRALASRTTAARTAAVALLGQARVWLRMRRPNESKALLCDLVRRSASPELRNQPFLSDARFLLDLAASLEILPNEAPGPFNDSPVVPLTSDWSLSRALDWENRPVASKPSPPKPGGGDKAGPPLFPAEGDGANAKGNRDESSAAVEVVEVQAGDPPLVRLFVQQMSLGALLDRLAEKARLHLDWSSSARQQIEGRSAIAAMERAPLSDALRALIEPLGLVWNIQGDKLILTSEEETSPEQLLALRRRNARQGLSEAVKSNPRHPLTPVAFLELGDLEYQDHRLDAALGWYDRLLREWPRSPSAIEAQYNIGLLRGRQGDRPAARQAFYRVIDRAPAHELTPLAYWRVGRMFLDEGDGEKALSPLRRALRAGNGTPAQSAAIVTVAAAHLLTDNPRAANAVLLEYRERIRHEQLRPAAVFLDTLARFRCADVGQRKRESGDLLAALLTARDDPILGPVGFVLMGQAYRELGMAGETARAYERALPNLREPLAGELTLALAEAYTTLEKHESAVKTYRRAIDKGSPSVSRRARLRLAEIALEQKKPQDCLKSCRELLQEASGVDAASVLRLMASAYGQIGERDKAIRCLQGELPP